MNFYRVLAWFGIIAVFITGAPDGTHACSSGGGAGRDRDYQCEDPDRDDYYPEQEADACDEECTCDDYCQGEENHVVESSGNLFYQVNLFKLKTTGPTLVVKLVYNSLGDLSTNGPVGKGWQFRYDLDIQAIGDPARPIVQQKDWDGGDIFFSLMEPGAENVYETSEGPYRKLIHQQNGWIETKKSCKTFYYDDEGTLTAVGMPGATIEDEQQIVFEYD